MPLNFNADEKVGDILQDRYDKSYEQYNMFQELAKQTEQVANPLERQKVRDYITSLEPEIKAISERGDFHNMRHQTAALARNAANNLKFFGDRAQQIQDLQNKIAASDDSLERKEYYQQLINDTVAQTTFNPETKTFNFAPIAVPNIVAKYDTNKFLQAATSNWIANKYPNRKVDELVWVKQGDKLPNGTISPVTGVYDTKSGTTERVDFNEVYNNVLKMASAEKGLWENIELDTNIEARKRGFTPEQRAAYKEQLTRKYLYDPLTGWANRAAYTQQTPDEISYNASATASRLATTPTTPVTDEWESGPTPGEVSPTLTDFSNKKVATLFDVKGIIKPTEVPQLSFIVNSLHKKAMNLKNSTNPEDQKLYDKLISAGVSSLFVKLQKHSKKEPHQKITSDEIIKLQNSLKEINVPIPSAFTALSPSDSRFKTELDARFPDAKGNPVSQMESLNYETFGSKEGLDISKKDDNYILGKMEGFDILDPETGQWNTFSSAIKGKGEGLTLSTPTAGSTMMRIVGKVKPGSVVNANDAGANNLSHLGTGYVVSINGKNYIIGNRKDKDTNNAKFNNLASFSRTLREGRYDTKGIDPNTKKPVRASVAIKSDMDNVYITNRNGTITVSNEDWDNQVLPWLYQTTPSNRDIYFQLATAINK